jgi:hypothetical protein
LRTLRRVTTAVFYLDYTPVVFSAADAEAATHAVERVRAQVTGLGGKRWMSVPLVNESGREDDHGLEQLSGAGQDTPFLQDLPACRLALERIREELGLVVHHARLLSLDPGGNFWPHKDAHDYVRFLLPLSAGEEGHALYLVDEEFYAARPGQAWYLQPDELHAAFNLSDERRYVVCVDGVNTRQLINRMATTLGLPRPLEGKLRFTAAVQESVRRILASVDPGVSEEVCRLLTLLSLRATDVSVRDLYDVFREVLRARGDCEELQQLFDLHPYFPEPRESAEEA